MTAAETRLFFLFQRAAHALKKQADAALIDAAGVSTAQAAVLVILLKEGPCTQRDIADRLLQRESAVTTMIERLIKAGFVARERSQTDRRAWELTVTEKGRDASDAMREAFAPINAALDEALQNVDIASLADGLTKLTRALAE